MGRADSGCTAIVAFRNLLIHGYASVNDMTVWHTIETSLPNLYGTIARLLDEAGAPLHESGFKAPPPFSWRTF